MGLDTLYLSLLTACSSFHIGDDSVPNAPFMIDKFCQIHRILLPLSTALAKIETEPHVREYATWKFGSVEGALQVLLRDFFQHGFDGSGGKFMHWGDYIWIQWLMEIHGA